MLEISYSILCNGFIAAMLLLLWGWDLPKGSRIKALVHRFSKPIVWLGLSHNWSMFAPIPISSNEKLRIEIKLTGGDWHEIVLDCMGKPGIAQRPEDIRALKMLHSLTCKGSNAMKPAIALYAARQYLREHRDLFAGDVTQVRLTRLYQIKPLWPPRKLNYNNIYYEEETYKHFFLKDEIWKRQLGSTDFSDRLDVA